MFGGELNVRVARQRALLRLGDGSEVTLPGADNAQALCVLGYPPSSRAPTSPNASSRPSLRPSFG